MLRRAIRKRLFNGKTAEEEREEPRVVLNLPIDYNAEKSPTSRPGYTSNLSPGGVLLNVPERLDIGQEITLRIFFAFGPELETVKVNSRVMWVRRVEKEGSYRSGVKFLDLSAMDRERLGRFFEKF